MEVNRSGTSTSRFVTIHFTNPSFTSAVLSSGAGLLLVVAAAGCTPSNSECATDRDCQRGYSCVTAGGLFVRGGRCAPVDGWSVPSDGDTGVDIREDSASDGDAPDDGADLRDTCGAGREICNGVDDDCDGRIDEPRTCPKTDGVCAGTEAACIDGERESCTDSYPSTYQQDETRLDGLDNDCDGTTDEVFETVDMYQNRVTCATMTSSDVYCWVDDGGFSFDRSFPVRGNYRAVAAGRNHACALDTTGSIDCWGGNRNQDLGIVDVPQGTYRTVAAGSQATCAVTDDMARAVVCWGVTGGSRSDRAFETVAVSTEQCGIDDSDNLLCWGANAGSPIVANVPSGRAERVAVSPEHACRVRPDRTVDCWGENAAPDPQGRFRAIDVGSTFSPMTGKRRLYGCGIRPNSRSISCWGYRQSIRETAPSEGAFVDVTVGREGGCAVRTDGALVCWGEVGRPDLATSGR